jgi:hypothetical protein
MHQTARHPWHIRETPFCEPDHEFLHVIKLLENVIDVRTSTPLLNAIRFCGWR